MRRTCCSRTFGSLSSPRTATSRSSSSGMLLHRKNDNREARSTSLRRCSCQAPLRGILLDAKQKSGRHQQSLERELDARLEVPGSGRSGRRPAAAKILSVAGRRYARRASVDRIFVAQRLFRRSPPDGRRKSAGGLACRPRRTALNGPSIRTASMPMMPPGCPACEAVAGKRGGPAPSMTARSVCRNADRDVAGPAFAWKRTSRSLSAVRSYSAGARAPRTARWQLPRRRSAERHAAWFLRPTHSPRSEQLDRFAVQPDVHLFALAEPLDDVLRRSSLQPDLDDVLAVDREVVPITAAAARAERQLVAHAVPPGRAGATAGTSIDDRAHRRIADRQPADLPGGRR